MCMFCAAMPVTIAAGASLQAKQRRERREAEERGQQPKRQAPAMALTGIALAVLAFISAFYHSQLNG